MTKLPIVQGKYEKYFPFDTIRHQQQLSIEFAVKNWSEGKKYVILELGTGVGKSAIGVCLSRYLRSSCNFDNLPSDSFEEGTWFLTTQKVLQEQYVSDFGHVSEPLKSIKSASNYTCQMFDSSKYQTSCAEISRLMKAHDFFKKMYGVCQHKCRYRTAKDAFLESLDSLTNYSYFFAESNYAGKVTPRQLLVLDECHTIEEQLGKFVEITISEKFAKVNLKKTMPRDISDMAQAVKWVKNSYKKALAKKITEIDSELQKLRHDKSSESGDVTTLSEFAKKYEMLDKHICKINRFLSEFTEENWVMNIVPAFGKSMRKLVFKPVDVSSFAHANLFNFGNKVLFLSATVLDKDVFCSSLGIDPKEAAFLRIPSPFPVENRPVYYFPVGKMNKNSIDNTLPKMVDAIKLLLEQHKDEKGIIHCTSFKVAKYIHENVLSTRLLIHDGSNRDQTVDYHCSTEKPTVLLSPSMMEGIDLRDNHSRFQVICKIPFPFLGDEVIRKRMSKNPTWYDCQTVRSVIQSFGRSIRNENDHATTYILDGDWEKFFNRTKKLFPSEIVAAMK